MYERDSAVDVRKKLELTNITEIQSDKSKLVTSADIQTLFFTLLKPPHEAQADIFDVNDVITYTETIALVYSPRQEGYSAHLCHDVSKLEQCSLW